MPRTPTRATSATSRRPDHQADAAAPLRLHSEGIAFYDFPEIHKLKPFKDVYRERLDALPLDDEARAAVVEEARLAFRLNADVFGELGAHVR